MTPHQQEIHRIIAGFSAIERELFLERGGVIPASIRFYPDEPWCDPKSFRSAFIRVPTSRRHKDRTSLIQIRIQGIGTLPFMEAAAALGVRENVLREKVRQGTGMIAGRKIKRVTPKRRFKHAA